MADTVFSKVLIARGQVHKLQFFTGSGSLETENRLEGCEITSFSVTSPDGEQIETSAINDPNPDKTYVQGATAPPQITLGMRVTTGSKQIIPPTLADESDVAMSPQGQYTVTRPNGARLFMANVNIKAPGGIEAGGKAPMDTQLVMQATGPTYFFAEG